MTGGGGSTLPRLVAASAASRERGAEVLKPGHEGAPRVAPAEMLRAAPPIGPRRHETTPATTVAGPTTGPGTARSGGVGGQAHVAEAQPDDEPALFLLHGDMEPHPVAPPATALLHLDEPRARVLLGNGSDDDRVDGWYLDSGATHHMTG